MREIPAERVVEAVRKLCMDANFNLGEDVLKTIAEMKEKEDSPTGQAILEQIEMNARIARDEEVPLCQDTGFAVFFVELGGDVHVVGSTLTEAIDEGVRQGYRDGFLRKSILSDPIERKNTGDNTPAVIHYDIVPGEKLKIVFAPKGGGSENMSRVHVFPPAAGIEGIKDFVVNRVRESGGNPCPPIIVGVGIGGTFEKCAEMAKRALLRSLGSKHENPFYRQVEEELFERINKLGVGPQGLGGRTTCLGVFVDTYACHIASLPMAVNIQCHSARHKEVEL